MPTMTSTERVRKWREDNPERAKAGAQRYYQENVDHLRSVARRQSAELPTETRQRYRQTYLSKPEAKQKLQERMRDYRQRAEVQERHRAEEAQRRAQKRTTEIEYIHPLILLETDDGICGVCQIDVDPFDFHMDHIIPLSLGGSHTYDNLQVTHPACNLAKSNKVGE